MRGIRTREVQEAIGPTTEYLEKLVSISHHVSQGVAISSLQSIMDSLYLPADAIIEASESLAEKYKDSLFNEEIKKELDYIRSCKNEMQLMSNCKLEERNSSDIMEFIINSARRLFDTNINLLLAQDRAHVRSLVSVLQKALAFTADFEKISTAEERKVVINKYMSSFPLIFNKIGERCDSLFDQDVVTSIKEALNKLKIALKSSITFSEKFLCANDPETRLDYKIEVVGQLTCILKCIRKIIFLLNYVDEASDPTPTSSALGNQLEACQFYSEFANSWLTSGELNLDSIGHSSSISFLESMKEFIYFLPEIEAIALQPKLDSAQNLFDEIKVKTNNFHGTNPEAVELGMKMSDCMKECLHSLTAVKENVQDQEKKSNGCFIVPSTTLNKMISILTSDIDWICEHPEQCDQIIKEVQKLTSQTTQLPTWTMSTLDLEEKSNNLCDLFKEAKKLAVNNTSESRKELESLFPKIKEAMSELSSYMDIVANSATLDLLSNLSADFALLALATKLNHDDPVSREILSARLPALTSDASKLANVGELLAKASSSSRNFSLERLYEIKENVILSEPVIKAQTSSILQGKTLTPDTSACFNSRIESIESLISSYLNNPSLVDVSFEDAIYSNELLMTCLKMQLKQAIEEKNVTEAIGISYKIHKLLPILIQNLSDSLERESNLSVTSSLFQKLEKLKTVNSSIEQDLESMKDPLRRIDVLKSILKRTSEIAEEMSAMSVTYGVAKMNLSSDSRWSKSEFETFKVAMEEKKIEKLKNTISILCDHLNQVSVSARELSSNGGQNLTLLENRANKAHDALQTSLQKMNQNNPEWRMFSEITRKAEKASQVLAEAEKLGLLLGTNTIIEDIVVSEEEKLSEAMNKLIPIEFEHVKTNILNPDSNDRILVAASTLHKKVTEAELSIDSHQEESMNHARIIALYFADLSLKFANLEELSGVIDISKNIAKHACAMLPDLRLAYANCKDRRTREKCKSAMEKIESLCTQLKILCAVKASSKNINRSEGRIQDTDDALIKCSENLMMAVQDAVAALASAKLTKLLPANKILAVIAYRN